MERRLFHREPVVMNGELTWVSKGRFSRRENQRGYVRTSNISLDGAQVEMAGVHPFKVDATVCLKLGLHRCDVRIKDVSHVRGQTILRLSFMSPSAGFVGVLEENLPVITTDRAKYEGKWL